MKWIALKRRTAGLHLGRHFWSIPKRLPPIPNMRFLLGLRKTRMIGVGLLLTVLACLTIAVHGRYIGATTQHPLELFGAAGSLSPITVPDEASNEESGAESYKESVVESEAKIEPEPLSKMKINSAVMWLDDHECLIDFYTQFTGNIEVTAIILEVSLVLDIPVNIAFSLAWKESRYDYRAVSSPNRGGSRDWGLFQLNDRGRAEWTKEEFFNLRKNTYSGLYYLKHCIAAMGGIRMGLAAYNAGVYGVKARGIPKTTRRYIDAIFAYEATLDEAFADWFYRYQVLSS